MTKGLHVWKDNGQCVILEPDNAFWAITPSQHEKAFIPHEVLRLHDRVKGKLTRAMRDFRFSQELTAIYINPTDKCNADCSYCYIPRKTRKQGHSLTTQELDFILTKLAKYFTRTKRKQVIIFHASEPLLVKNIIFPAIAQYSNIFKFGLQTNATLLEKDDVDFLKNHLVGVGISLDSPISAANNRQRPMANSGGNFEAATRAIDWFNGYPGLNVITTVTKHTVNTLPDMIRFLHAKKVPCVLCNPLRFTRIPLKELKPDDTRFAKYFIAAVETAIALTKASRQKIIIGNFSNTVLAIIAPQARRLMCDISPCGGGRCFFTITATGEMIPCGEFIGMEGFSGGNIFRDEIDTAMRSKGFRTVRTRIVENINECDCCELRNICGAPCPAELQARGNMSQKAIFCDFYKETIKYAFRVIAEHKVPYVLRDEALGGLSYEYNLHTQNNKGNTP